MSLQFCFGPSGAGKSRYLYEKIIEESKRNPKQNFLIIVPDQFTMQTQKDLVTLHDRGGIMNIDVLSFGRLGHRILEEVGRQDLPVLDDTGKSLVLQKVAADLREEMPALGSLLQKQGYIHEAKSAISEFMQYGIGTEDVGKLIEYAGKHGALVQKLKDLETLYRGFVGYIRERFITTEETLDVLRRSLAKSHILPGSVVVFDGFTGFTPIQNYVIQELMTICDDVIVSLTMGIGENPYLMDGEQKLFYLSKKTVASLDRLAREAQVERKQDIFILPGVSNRANHWQAVGYPGWQEQFGEQIRWVINEEYRTKNSRGLEYLEKSLFRYGQNIYPDKPEDIRMFEADTPGEEVHLAGLFLRKLIQEEGLAYRDIAVVTGNLEEYAPFVEKEFSGLDIPCYIDRTRGVALNPMVEAIKSVLELYLKDFSYEAVFHYLRSGLSDIPMEAVDELENYVIQTGIRGYRQWSRLFTHKTKAMGEDEEPLQRLNALREQFMQQVSMLFVDKKGKASYFVECLYEFLVDNEVQQKLADYEKHFTEEGDLGRAREYAQIYRLIMELLDQVHGLLGEEEITMQEFSDILEAGFGEIEVGTIPQNVDRVLVGDMERTRLSQVKVLFFLGINDGNIPKNASKGGIISDIDREFLKESELELAPTPRQQMYIQRLYLYLNMTKPSDRLYLSFARMNREGKSIRPAYLIDTIRKIFPGLSMEEGLEDKIERMVTPREGERYLAQLLRSYVDGTLPKEEEAAFYAVYQAYDGEERQRLLTEAAFRRYEESGLSKEIARALYGYRLENSVTRLETFAACAYRHFLQYGLTLREREEFGFEDVDMGNVYHGVLEIFSGKLSESEYTWFDFPREYGVTAVAEALQAYAASYGDTILYSSARNAYAIRRMERILTRTVFTLQEQLKRGVFRPENYEVSFQFAGNLDSIDVTLSEQEKMRLKGRIDRIDVAEDNENVYVKVIDYKSGNRKFDLTALYYGLQLQLVVYLNAAVEMEQKKHPDKNVIPGAILYYHIDDPTVESQVELSDTEVNQLILQQLKMTGIVNASPEVVERLDRTMEDKSDIIPVERKKDGTYSARSSIMTGEELRIVSDYVNNKVKNIGRHILEGEMTMNPYERGTEEACTYCVYKKVCGFDSSIPGYRKRTLEGLDKEELFSKMQNFEE
ncbi:MAG: exodeoxyribonuclease V subunit gamma [Acetatifactor sp.]|nr:exodeoxyribonuclease V subunit gamma [Acetatifactor sp.]